MGVGVVGFAWSGCSIEKHYELLSFFFDGVPNPNALSVTGSAGGFESLRDSPTYSAHRPFLDEQCSECHTSQFSTSGVSADVCMNCHDDVPTSLERMHGPVAAGACLWCHVPHESAFASLLKEKPRAVCGQCHEQGLLNTSKVPAHADETRQCLECHYGHGGTSSYFLRPDAKRAQPGNQEP